MINGSKSKRVYPIWTKILNSENLKIKILNRSKFYKIQNSKMRCSPEKSKFWNGRNLIRTEIVNRVKSKISKISNGFKNPEESKDWIRRHPEKNLNRKWDKSPNDFKYQSIKIGNGQNLEIVKIQKIQNPKWVEILKTILNRSKSNKIRNHKCVKISKSLNRKRVEIVKEVKSRIDQNSEEAKSQKG